MEIRGRKGGKGGGGGVAYAPYEAPNTLQSRNLVRIVDLISEGEVVGLVDGAKSIYFDDTPLQNADGSYNFQGVTFETREGLPDQDPILGFPEVETEVPVGLDVTVAGGPVTRTVAGDDLDAVRVKIRIPNLSHLQSDGVSSGLYGTSVAFSIEVAPDGGPFVVAVSTTISGKTVSTYEREFRIELPAGGSPWQIRVTRLTADSTESVLQNRILWSSYTRVTDVKLVYPDSALVGLQVNAEQFGQSIPTRSYDYFGLIFEVPSNYDPETRGYTGIWDGTFQLAWTDNPAWVFYGLATNERWGLGRFVDPDQVDKFGLYTIAQYCDGLVPDGSGGEEPRFTFNGVMNEQVDAISALNAIASAFRGMPFWSSGATMVAQDAPADPVKLVAPANVIDGQFDYQGTALKARHSVVYVTWNDPADGYRAVIEPVEDPELITRFGVRIKDVLAVGCTSRGQAHRYGRWILDAERYATEAVRYRTGFDHADLRPGDVILIADPARAGVRLGGRLASATVGEAVLDAAIELEVGETYELSVELPTGEVETRAVTTGAGTTATLQVSPDFSAAPNPHAMWAVTASNVEPVPYRVMGLAELEKNVYEVTALQHDPTRYDRVERDMELPQPSFSVLPSGALPTLDGLAVSEYLYLVAGTVLAGATLSWSPPRDGRAQLFEVEVTRPGAAGFQPLGFVSSVSIEVRDVQAGAHTFRVRALSFLGQKGPWSTLETSLFALAAPPADVENFHVESVLGAQVLSAWTPNTELDLAGYRIRRHPSVFSPSWGGAGLLAEVSAGASSALLPLLPGTYLIVAYDTSGKESENAATLTVGAAGETTIGNLLFTFEEHPDFDGVFTDTAAVGGLLFLEPEGTDSMDGWDSLEEVVALVLGSAEAFEPEGYYDFDADSLVDLGGVFETQLEAILVYSPERAGNSMASWLVLEDVESLAGATNEQADAVLQYQITLDDPAGSPVWGDWIDFTATLVSLRGIRPRVKMRSLDGLSTPVATEVGIRIGMASRVEAAEGVAVGTGGLRVTYGSAFYAVPALVVTGQNLSAGEIPEVTNKDETGFDIRFLDSGGSPVARTFDWNATGHGALQA